MFFISKKIFIFIIITISIGLIFAIGNIILSNEAKQKNISIVSLPVSGRTIVLDAGHGLPDKGAEGINGTTEYEINLNITKKVQALLEQSGCNVVLTRSDENGIYDVESSSIKEKKRSDILNRVKIGNESSADAFISIHLNKISDSKYYGWQTFFKTNSNESENLAKSIQSALNDSMQRENKREALKITGKYIIEHVEIPITIVECGFLSNPEEEEMLKKDDYQNRIAWGIYCGVMDFSYN